jgi:hypothetical protein
MVALDQSPISARRDIERGPMNLIWKFLNSPFCLWLLSSVVIAMLVSFVSDEQRCYSTAVTRVPQLAKSASELDLRMLEIIAVVHGGKPRPAIEGDIKAIVNGSTYFYQDYKGKSLLDTQFDLGQGLMEIAQIGQKESLDPSAFSTKEAIEDIIKLMGSTPIDQKEIDRLRTLRFESKDQVMSENPSLTEFPFVLKETQTKFEKLLEQPPCQPFYLMRDRMKLYVHGLG